MAIWVAGVSRPIAERMAEALAHLRERWNGKRYPKAFYLRPDDWRDFMATNPPTMQSHFGNNPPMVVTDPAFQGIPVRESTSKMSRLYNHTQAGCELPQ